jgi:hypothetical protein
MQNELIYQAKTHTISEKLYKKKKKILHLFRQILFVFLVENNKIEKQQGHAYGKGNNI